MERIEKIENIINDNSVTKTIMTISDGEKKLDAEIYLAYIDNSTGKRYVVYTTDLEKTENEKGTFSLATLKFNQNEYILEETSKEDHQDIELKALNIIGLSGDKNPEEIKKEFERELPDVTIMDLASLKGNVDNMTISSNKPPKKANMPMAIANVIKRYYLFELNLELKKIYSGKVSNENLINSDEKLNKIDNKLDELKDVYNDYASNGNVKAEKSLSQIEKAKESIMEAKKSIDARKDEEQGIDLVPELPETDLEEYQDISKEENTLEEKYDVSDSIKEETNKIKEEVNKIMEEEKNQMAEEPAQLKEELENTIQEEPKVDEVSNTEQDKEEIQNEKQEVINESVNKFGLSVESIVSQLTNGISSVYEEKLQKKEEENNKLREQISSSENEKSELLTMVSDVKNKALQASEQAKNSKAEITSLKNKNTELEKENVELKGTVDSQKQLLDQQNSNMEALREEGKTRETTLLQEIESLKQENNRLKQYENAYNQIVGMVNSQRTASEPTNNVKK